MRQTTFRTQIVTREKIIEAMLHFDQEKRKTYTNWRKFRVEK